jgi:hypothetical protein
MSRASRSAQIGIGATVSPKERRALLAEIERLQFENERRRAMRFEIARLKAENARLRGEGECVLNREEREQSAALTARETEAELAERRRRRAEERSVLRLQRPAQGGLPGLGKRK